MEIHVQVEMCGVVLMGHYLLSNVLVHFVPDSRGRRHIRQGSIRPWDKSQIINDMFFSRSIVQETCRPRDVLFNGSIVQDVRGNIGPRLIVMASLCSVLQYLMRSTSQIYTYCSDAQKCPDAYSMATVLRTSPCSALPSAQHNLGVQY
jgi:hypothetical protein